MPALYLRQSSCRSILARNRRFGRALAHRPGFEQKFAGAVYRYEALAAGQIFEALILCENETDVEKLLDILEGDLYLGGSRKAGYGRAKINDAELIGKNWREAGGELTLKKWHPYCYLVKRHFAKG